VIASAGRVGGTRRIVAPTLAYLTPLAGALVALAAGVETRKVVAAVAAAAVLCAVARAVVEHMRIEADRERADEWIAMRAGLPPADELLLARIDELLDPRLRGALARSFRRIAQDALSTGRAVSPGQLNRHRLRPHVPVLMAVADRLADRTRPVSPRGVALAYRLVTTGAGPLYLSRRGDELAPKLRTTLAALEVEQVGGQAATDASGLEERAA
jgi:hypothetical protein